MRVLGISAYYHDSAAALLEDGRITAAVQEERLTRRKHDAAFPRHAIESCLEIAGLGLEDVDCIAFYDKPFLKFERLLETYVAFAPRGFRSFRMAIPVWLREKLFQKDLLLRELAALSPGLDCTDRLLFSEHHLSHAASAYYPSPFDEAVVLTADGVGEWTTTSVAIGRGERLDIVRELHFPHSLGLLYSAFTYYLGFRVNSGEYKVMGLAPYGEPRYRELILSRLMDLKADGTFRLDMRYFDYCTGLTMTNRRFDQLFGGPPRRPEAPIEQRHKDLAASIQAVIEEAMLRLTRALAHEFRLPDLCLAGGVALNCVANGRILRDGAFERLWVQPAAGDAGGALGAALVATHLRHGRPRAALAAGERDAMSGALLGPGYSDEEIAARLAAAGARFELLDEDTLLERSVDALVEEAAVGWFQGRMEFGPRALGSRSILADPRPAGMNDTLNLKVKFRESFRPFAPAVPRENVADWFGLDQDSPYMLMVAPVTRPGIPAVTHVDGSARVQTVHADTHPRFHRLLAHFHARTGCPVLVNTSFNVRGEPLVCTPEDAFRCFMGTRIEWLVAGRCLLRKSEQNPALAREYHQDFEPD